METKSEELLLRPYGFNITDSSSIIASLLKDDDNGTIQYQS